MNGQPVPSLYKLFAIRNNKYPCVFLDVDHVFLFLSKEVGYHVVEEVLPAAPVGAEGKIVDLGARDGCSVLSYHNIAPQMMGGGGILSANQLLPLLPINTTTAVATNQ